ncbi:hypothetical protein Mal64_15130 [Pseudobythopirellula maris]|uniref:Uncharacterized protein n=1 Tax=Pseudobythopirellula maris TaxID=2527991 RepID=A0A5C5ZU59_9BACT|nr:DNA-processing protein DprA [Pseudobythopirellula maris]TWT91114.1 hypothetical protein Mal64_15130 [Pseudobythopirellula maris]
MDWPDDLIAEMRLGSTRGLGPRTRSKLLAAFGSAEGALRAAGDELRRVSGVGPKLVQAMAGTIDAAEARRRLDRARELGIEPVVDSDPRYPASLREIPDPPAVLYVRGVLEPADQMAVAVVGTRRPTRYGERATAWVAESLARAGLVVVSGLARGVDGVAHRAALGAGVRTIAVMAGGLHEIYPPEHRRLADEVAAQGALVTESPPGTPPMSGSFPQRNRIISGLSLGVVVVEAAGRSGALITARHATEQGREVFAMPGPFDSPQSVGCHRLIQDGAKLVTSIDDILEELGSLTRPIPGEGGASTRSVGELKLTDQERLVLQAIEAAPTAIDDVIDRSELPAHRVLATVSMLETRNLIRRVSGALVVRV